MTLPTTTCDAVREWLSAERDGENGPDDSASAHLETCVDCQEWVRTFDHLGRQVRLRAPMPLAPVTAAVTRIAREASPVPHAKVGRVLLAAAALSGLVFLVLGATGTFGHSHLGSSDGRQAEALTISLLGGFALTAWRPARLAAGLLPVALLAAAITLAMSVVEVTSGAVPVADELSHLPVIIGAAGAAIAARATTVTPPGVAAQLFGRVPAAQGM